MSASNAMFILRSFYAKPASNNAVSPYRGRHSTQSAPNGGAICRRMRAAPCNWIGDATTRLGQAVSVIGLSSQSGRG